MITEYKACTKAHIIKFLAGFGWTDNPHLGDQSETWMLSPDEQLEVIAYADGRWSLSERDAANPDEWNFKAGSPIHPFEAYMLARWWDSRTPKQRRAERPDLAHNPDCRWGGLMWHEIDTIMRSLLGAQQTGLTLDADSRLTDIPNSLAFFRYPERVQIGNVRLV